MGRDRHRGRSSGSLPVRGTGAGARPALNVYPPSRAPFPSAADPLPGVAIEERQRAAVELLDVLIDRGVRAVFEDSELRALDPFGERPGEAGRRHGVTAA